MSEIEETLERIKSHQGVDSYVIINNDGEVLRQLPSMTTEYAKELGAEIFNLAQKARHVVRDLKPENDLHYLRLRTRSKEVLVSPGKDFMVVIIQSWPAEWEK